MILSFSMSMGGKCGPNEHFEVCGPDCGDLTCEIPTYDLKSCSTNCSSQCFCNGGFVRNSENVCIPKDDCRRVPCGPNEIRFWYGPDRCEATCQQPAPSICFTKDILIKCICEEGFIRDNEFQRNCIPIDSCSSETCEGENEFYNTCGSACGDLTCNNYNNHSICDREKCTSGGYCISDYVRNDQNVCVPRDKCPIICGPNEELLPNAPADKCEPTCQQINVPQCLDSSVIDKCVCKEGFVRATKFDRNCVPISLCPLICKDNEIFTRCGSSCGDLTCDVPNQSEMSCNETCVEGCFCSPGYVRDSDGKCIQCQDCKTGPCSCGENEHFISCGTICSDSCDLHGLPRTCIDTCVNKCFCKEGFSRDRNGNCIPEHECPNYFLDKACGSNEELLLVGPADECEPTCQKLIVTECSNSGVMNKCVCKEGFVRDNNFDRNCVPIDTCPSTCKAFETFTESGSGCGDLTCEITTLERSPCLKYKQKGCLCNAGYFRNSDGICTPCSECKNGRCSCGRNEIYTLCGSACPKTCETLGKKNNCTEQCIEGCFCDKGFVRGPYGNCIRKRKCPQIECGQNEHYERCGRYLDDLKCEERQSINIKISPPRKCNPKCYCDEGFYRNDEGVCIPWSECPNACGPNQELYFPYTPCEGTCLEPFRTDCDKIGSTDKCVCIEGYVRDNHVDKNCIPLSFCPQRKGASLLNFELFGKLPYFQEIISSNNLQHVVELFENAKLVTMNRSEKTPINIFVPKPNDTLHNLSYYVSNYNATYNVSKAYFDELTSEFKPF
ncbi:CLUMA_CG001491, isoform A [Clunio marinus]|uniref:CLUMA_CG001491, isoform A n=1 Tax=Clunio marinus TaxID=568069 RepID=A0A1J1HI61_9DIPT|nr:CLUMA_CG001491, isoform A [Clunio marinus]